MYINKKDLVAKLRACLRQAEKLYEEIRARSDKLLDQDKEDSDEFAYVEEDYYIIAQFVDKIDDLIRDLGKTHTKQLIPALNTKTWKNNKLKD